MNSIAQKRRESGAARIVLELDVNNHAGVMSHVAGLFSRRAYNVESILCMPVGEGRLSRIWLAVGEDARLEQMIRQLEKLEDVLSVRRCDAGCEVFERGNCVEIP
jgi:acetolactate synthase-1/3 small subunit